MVDNLRINLKQSQVSVCEKRICSFVRWSENQPWRLPEFCGTYVLFHKDKGVIILFLSPPVGPFINVQVIRDVCQGLQQSMKFNSWRDTFIGSIRVNIVATFYCNCLFNFVQPLPRRLQNRKKWFAVLSKSNPPSSHDIQIHRLLKVRDERV